VDGDDAGAVGERRRRRVLLVLQEGRGLVERRDRLLGAEGAAETAPSEQERRGEQGRGGAAGAASRAVRTRVGSCRLGLSMPPSLAPP
jgi:hypothetical protein